MKILYLLGSLHRGGAETLILDIFQNADKFGFDFHCLHRFRGGIFQSEFYKSSAKMQYLPCKPHQILSYLKELRKYLKISSPEIIHAHQPIDALYALIASFRLGIPVVQTLHSYDFETRRIAKLALLVSLRFAKLNIFVSNYQKNYYTKKYSVRDKSDLVLYNSISLEKFRFDDINRYELRKELNLPENKIILISVGNFTEVRNQLKLCEFANLLKRKYLNFHLIFVGAKVERFPEYYDRCIDYCSKNELQSYVTFLGSRNDVPNLLKQSEAFIYYTEYDTFGIAVVEAMAADLPVFVNDWEVMKEISNNGELATIYDSNNLNDLVEKFIQYTQHTAEYRAKSSKAKLYVETNFSINTYMSKLKKVYCNLIKQSKNDYCNVQN